MEGVVYYVLQLHWLPFFGVMAFAIIATLEYRSCLGIFSPSGLTSLYAFIKFSMESLLVLNFESLTGLARIYGVSDQEYISQAILISFMVSSFSYVMLWACSYSIRSTYSHSIGYLYRKTVTESNVAVKIRWVVPRVSFGYFTIFIFGLLFLLFVFQGAGGIVNYVSNFSNRTEMLAGYGAVVKFSSLFIQLAVLYFFAVKCQKSPMFSYAVLLTGMTILFALGGRTAPIFLLFTGLVYVHFCHKKFIITLRMFLLFSILFMAALFISLLRFDNIGNLWELKLSEIPFELWFSIIGAYFTYIIRDSVIITYFSDNEFWHGSGLLSFLYAFIPRALYPEKPVVDNGVYVIAMTNGQQVKPPMVPEELPSYGWPESYMSGYLEAGWLGLILGVALSCCLVHFVFSRLMKSNFKIEWVFLYCFFTFRQPLYLTSIDLFNIVFHFVFVLGVGFMVRKKFVIYNDGLRGL